MVSFLRIFMVNAGVHRLHLQRNGKSCAAWYLECRFYQNTVLNNSHRIA